MNVVNPAHTPLPFVGAALAPPACGELVEPPLLNAERRMPNPESWPLLHNGPALLDAVLVCFYHLHIAGCVYYDVEDPPELAVAGTLRAPLGDELIGHISAYPDGPFVQPHHAAQDLYGVAHIGATVLVGIGARSVRI